MVGATCDRARNPAVYDIGRRQSSFARERRSVPGDPAPDPRSAPAGASQEGRMTHCTPIACALWLAAALASLSAQGQTVSIAELVRYDGPDRARRILEGAKREGEMSLYTSLTAATAAKVKADFERRYGIRINLWRASSENILQRVATEARAGRADFDVVETNGPEMEAI